MDRLNQILTNRTKPALSIFFTAGFPTIDSTVRIGCELAASGVDFLEVGIPFSDPIADGPVIQASNNVALKNGMNLELLLGQVKELTAKIDIPILLMGYLNPIMQYGEEKFFKKAAYSGVAGVILPDMPLIDFHNKYKNICQELKLATPFLITPQTTKERVMEIDNASTGFIYAVSSFGTTGKALDITASQEEYLKRIKSYNLKNPVIVGFGISDKKSFNAVTQYAAGAIVGSAFIRHLGEKGETGIGEFVKSIRE